MLKKLAMLAALAVCALAATAQDYYKFYYIAHADVSDGHKIANELTQINADAQEGGNTFCVYYMANGDSPLVVTSAADNDMQEKFRTMLDRLRRELNHYPDINIDLYRVLEVLAEMQPGSGAYVDYNFYINGREFWDLGYNEDLIAPLLVALDVDNDPNASVTIYCNEADRFTYDAAHPLGEKYVGRLNDNFDFVRY